MQANSFQVCVNSLRFAGGMTNSSAQLERKWHKRRLSRQRVLLMTNLMRIFSFFVFCRMRRRRGLRGRGRGARLSLSGPRTRAFFWDYQASCTETFMVVLQCQQLRFFGARKLFHSNFSQLFPLRRCTALLLLFNVSVLDHRVGCSSLTDVANLLPTSHHLDSGDWKMEMHNSLCLPLSPSGRSRGGG